MQGKIIKGIAGFYYVHDGHSRIYECKAKGIFRNKKIKPLVGDDVMFDVISDEEQIGNITDILPRNNELIRPAVSNIDQALIIFAAKDPEPNLNLLDRFLIMMEYQQVPCTICFNKLDLEDKDQERLAGIYGKAGYAVRFMSVTNSRGTDELRALLEGKTTVLAGPSGVGKSSFLNLLCPLAEMETGSVSEKIRRGRHTTRHSELFYIGNGSYVMDTPGFSSMDINMILADDLKYYFPEFTPMEGECRFIGCAHMEEPGCAVKQAVESGAVSRERYETYRGFYLELKSIKRY